MSILQHFKQSFTDLSLPQGQPILLAVSGGVDSMVMCHLLLKAKLPFAVAHCNFKLRGEEADKDEALVAAWAKENKVPFYNTSFNTQQKADEWKKGIQETARILRYEWLEQIRKEHHYAAIATAHHANDNVETLLMNLFKGTGIAGLHGIKPKHANIIRPLLFAQKAELLAYAAEQQIKYRDDASNKTDKYTRNDIRLNIIPVIEQSFPDVVTSINKSITRFAEAEELYNKAVEQEIKKLTEKRGKDIYIPIRKLSLRSPLNTICYELFKPYGFTAQQVPHIVDLMGADSGHYIDSSLFRVIKDRNFLIITSLETSDSDAILIDKLPVTVRIGDETLSFKPSSVPDAIPSDNNTAYIDASKLKFPLLLRTWKQGDYFYPIGMGMKKKKLSKYFKDQKLPLHEKDRVWVLESDKRIVWLVGHRMDERFKLKPSTEEAVLVKLS